MYTTLLIIAFLCATSTYSIYVPEVEELKDLVDYYYEDSGESVDPSEMPTQKFSKKGKLTKKLIWPHSPNQNPVASTKMPNKNSESGNVKPTTAYSLEISTTVDVQVPETYQTTNPQLQVAQVAHKTVPNEPEQAKNFQANDSDLYKKFKEKAAYSFETSTTVGVQVPETYQTTNSQLQGTYKSVQNEPEQEKNVLSNDADLYKKVKEQARLELGIALNNANKLLSENKIDEWKKVSQEANAEYLKKIGRN